MARRGRKGGKEKDLNEILMVFSPFLMTIYLYCFYGLVLYLEHIFIRRRYGCIVLSLGGDILPDLGMALHLFGKPVGGGMSLLYIIGGILSFGLLIYLLIALLKPEVFS